MECQVLPRPTGVVQGTSTQCRPVPVYAAVHHRKDSRGARAFGGHLIDNAVLEPQCGKLQPDALVDQRRDMLRSAKNIHDVYALTRPQNLRKVREIGHRRLAENGLRSGSDGNDAIAKAL
jgi:hypothetical protein